MAILLNLVKSIGWSTCRLEHMSADTAMAPGDPSQTTSLVNRLPSRQGKVD